MHTMQYLARRARLSVTLKDLFFLHFFRKTTPYSEIFKIMFPKCSSWHRSTCCVQISWNLADRKSAKRALLTWQKNSTGSLAVAIAAIAPKICQGQPPIMYSKCSRIHPNRFTFGGVIGLAERVTVTKARLEVNPTFGWSLASSRLITKRI